MRSGGRTSVGVRDPSGRLARRYASKECAPKSADLSHTIQTAFRSSARERKGSRERDGHGTGAGFRGNAEELGALVSLDEAVDALRVFSNGLAGRDGGGGRTDRRRRRYLCMHIGSD